ncbi:MAG: response regulator [Candidatus Latescibacteria bacterium]|nr:response regulator [Candidatus Latescibacterota bacterium]
MNDTEKIRVLVADDHVLFRSGLKMVLEDTPDMVVADEAGTGREALHKAVNGDFDVLLLDISMPERSGFDILKDLKNLKPDLPVLILTMHPEDKYAVRVLKAGASGYLTKKNAPDELVAAIRKVLTGGRYVSPSLAEKIAFELQEGTEKSPLDLLSNREYQVMCLIASGKSISDIADELSLSINTVSTYRARILEKMRLKNTAELIHYAIANNLVEES